MQTDDWSVEQCLDAYPDYREVLGPLLMLGEQMHSNLAPRSPDPEFAKNAGIRLQNRLSLKRKQTSPHEVPSSGQKRRYLRPAYLLASAALVITLLASGVGVVGASASSLPGDTLYGFKLAREQLALTFSLTSEGDQALLTRYAEERLEEADALLAQDRLDDLPAALEGFESALGRLESLNDENDGLEPGSLEHLQDRLDNHIQVLQSVIDKAPEQARGALQNALEKSSHSREVLESVRGEGHPSDNAPGQNKPEQRDKDKEADDENDPGNSGRGQGQGPKPKDEKENGPPPWANND
jgi:hypothetical protein